MIGATIPANEPARLEAVRIYRALDDSCSEAVRNIVDLAAELTECPIGIVTLVDAQQEWFKARHGFDTLSLPREYSFCAHAILTPWQLMIVEDVERDPRFAGNPFVTRPPGVRFYAGMPLVNPKGAALGTLCLMDHKPRKLTAMHHKVLARLAETVMSTLELHRVMADMRRLSAMDDLTGLPNRVALHEALDKAISRSRRHDEGFAPIYMDLDGFKLANDTLGHTMGDEVLRNVATVFARCLRNEDVAARLGGDEFAVLLVGDPSQADVPAERIRAAVAADSKKFGWNVTASLGLMLFHLPPATSIEALYQADMLMYKAKLAGRDRVERDTYERC